MNELQNYNIWEFVEDYKSGQLSRRELMRRVLYITGGVASAASVLSMMGCGTSSAPASPSAQVSTAPAVPASAAASASPAASAKPAASTAASAKPAASTAPSASCYSVAAAVPARMTV